MNDLLEFDLGFDPFQDAPDDGDAKLTRTAFKDPIARALWLFVRRNHIVCQHFAPDVLTMARRIAESRPSTVDELQNILFYSKDPALREPWRASDDKGKARREEMFKLLLDVLWGRQRILLKLPVSDQLLCLKKR